MESGLVSKAFSCATTKNAAVMNQKRMAAKKMAARYSKIRAKIGQDRRRMMAESSRKIPTSGVPMESTFLRYYPHFKTSGVPKHIFYYVGDQWILPPEDLLGAIKEELLRQNPVVEVQTDDEQSVLDFIHMYRLDLGTGVVVPMAWMDEADNCFFPSIVGKEESSPKKQRCQRGMNLLLEVSTKGQQQPTTAAVMVPTEADAMGENLGNLKGKEENGSFSRAIDPVVESQDQPPREQEANDDPEEPAQTDANRKPDTGDVRLPRSPFLPFSVLLPLLVSELPPSDMRRIDFFYRNFQARNITRQTLVDRVRLIVGDDVLRRIIETFSPPIVQNFARMNQRRLVEI